jgi:hypothetical protein
MEVANGKTNTTNMRTLIEILILIIVCLGYCLIPTSIELDEVIDNRIIINK